MTGSSGEDGGTAAGAEPAAAGGFGPPPDDPRADVYPVTPAEREAAVAVLVGAAADGRLTLEEFGRRTEVVLATPSREAIVAATRSVERPAVGRAPTHWFVPFGNRVRRGRFVLAPRTKATMWFSEIHLDLRGAVLTGPEPVIRVHAFVGTVRILLPVGVQVEVDQSSLFGGRSITTFGPPPSAARPLLRVRIVDVLGAVKVSTDPETWSPYLAAHRPL